MTGVVELDEGPAAIADWEGNGFLCPAVRVLLLGHAGGAEESEGDASPGGCLGMRRPCVVDGEGSVTNQPAGIDCDSQGGDCSETYYAYQSTVVTLTATAGEGARLAGWSGACSGTQATCQVTMDISQTVTATFGPDVVQVFLPLVLRNP